MKKTLILLSCFLLTSVALAAPVTLFSDDFESYTTNTALTAAYDANTITGLYDGPSTYTLDNKSVLVAAADLAGTVLTGHFTPHHVTTDTLTVTHWIYDSNGTGATPYNGRAGLSFASYSGGTWAAGTLENYVYFGVQHGTSTDFYCTRVVSGGSGWLATTAPRTVGWHEMKQVLHGGTMNVYMDGNPVASGSDTYNNPASGWNCFRIGSTAGSSYIDLYVDNVSIESDIIVPAAVNDWFMY